MQPQIAVNADRQRRHNDDAGDEIQSINNDSPADDASLSAWGSGALLDVAQCLTLAIHLLLIGIPIRFGSLATGFGYQWFVPETLLPDACAEIFSVEQSLSAADDANATTTTTTTTTTITCSEIEYSMLTDYGVRNLLHYELSWIVSIMMMMAVARVLFPRPVKVARRQRNNTTSSRRRREVAQHRSLHQQQRQRRRWQGRVIHFHKVLLACSVATVLFMSWAQDYYLHNTTADVDATTSTSKHGKNGASSSSNPLQDNTTTESNNKISNGHNLVQLNPDFVASIIFYHALAIMASLWTIFMYQRSGHQQQNAMQQQQHNNNNGRNHDGINHINQSDDENDDLLPDGNNYQQVPVRIIDTGERGEQENHQHQHQQQHTRLQQQRPKRTTQPSYKWSIPGNSICFGAIVNGLVVIAQVQCLMNGNFESYLMPSHHHDNAGTQQQQQYEPPSSIMRYGFIMATFHTAIHAAVLFQIRYFMTVPQLRTICLYKTCLNIVLPLAGYWYPELAPYMGVDTRLTWMLRLIVTTSYLNGYLFAGQAEGVSRILTSEKED